jgi:hypothetical protein
LEVGFPVLLFVLFIVVAVLLAFCLGDREHQLRRADYWRNSFLELVDVNAGLLQSNDELKDRNRILAFHVVDLQGRLDEASSLVSQLIPCVGEDLGKTKFELTDEEKRSAGVSYESLTAVNPN